MSAPRKYPDSTVARVKALDLLQFGPKRIAHMVEMPISTVRRMIEAYRNIEPDKDFIDRFRKFCKGEP